MILSPDLVAPLTAIVGADAVLWKKEDLFTYECDAYTVEKAVPQVVVLPSCTEQVAQIVRLAHRERIPFLARGAGTGLAGGALATHGGIVIGLSRMNRILSIDLRNRRIVAQAGAVNFSLSRAVDAQGYFYAPDPSSQKACTIGGNVANNSGGPHTLKYGVTTNHVLGLKLVMPDGEVVELGGPVEESPGYDLVGLVVGSEGTLGVVTEVTARLERKPQATIVLLGVFETVDGATQTVSDVIAAGIVPSALEMMDQVVLQAVEKAYHFGFPLDAGAVLLVELDGLEAGLERQATRVRDICQANGVREVRDARTPAEQAKLWKARKTAIGTVGKLAPSNCTQDGVIPRTRLPEVLRRIGEIGREYNILIANVFHAGDGNLHPCMLFDERDPDQVRRMVQAGSAVLRLCVEMGGTISGEHGIGIEKIDFMSLIFSPRDLEAMAELRAIFNPDGLCNPGKMLPTSKGCVELMRKRGAPAL